MKVARLKDTTAGRIELDGQAAESARARSWWREVTVVSPRLSLFRGSVESNATLGAKSRAEQGEHQRILHAFGLSEPFADATMAVDGQPACLCEHALRAARAVLRDSALVLVADADLVADEQVFGVFLDELEASGTTVIVAGDLPENRQHKFRQVDTARPSDA